MSLTLKQALPLAERLLDAIVADTRNLSTAIAALQTLTHKEWSIEDEATFAAAADTIAELCERYRTGESIATITRAPRVLALCRDVLPLAGGETRCQLPAGHQGAHSDGPRRWTS